MREVIMRYSGEGETAHGLTRVGELVRCKECRYWMYHDNGLSGTCSLLRIYPTSRFYCASGRKRGT